MTDSYLRAMRSIPEILENILLYEPEGIEIEGFGTFTTRWYRGFYGTNPRSAEHIRIPEKRMLFLRVDPGFLRFVETGGEVWYAPARSPRLERELTALPGMPSEDVSRAIEHFFARARRRVVTLGISEVGRLGAVRCMQTRLRKVVVFKTADAFRERLASTPPPMVADATLDATIARLHPAHVDALLPQAVAASRDPAVRVAGLDLPARCGPLELIESTTDPEITGPAAELVDLGTPFASERSTHTLWLHCTCGDAGDPWVWRASAEAPQSDWHVHELRLSELYTIAAFDALIETTVRGCAMTDAQAQRLCAAIEHHTNAPQLLASELAEWPTHFVPSTRPLGTVTIRSAKRWRGYAITSMRNGCRGARR